MELGWLCSPLFEVAVLASPTTQSAFVSDEDPFLDVFEAAAIPKLHPQTIREAFREGRLRGVKVNGSRVLRFRRSWVIDWLESNRATT